MKKTFISFVNIGGLILMLAVATPSRAASDRKALTDQITRLLNETINRPSPSRPTIEVTLLTPPDRLDTLCARPVLSLSGNPGRLPGLHTLIAQCDGARHFLQIRVKATGTWWQATHLIPRGATVTSQDIRPRQGSLEHQPAGLIVDARNIIGCVALRAIHPGEDLQQGQLRLPWAIQAGDEVEVSFQGAGFTLRTRAKALDNAALAQRLRLKSASGKILIATATADHHAAVDAE